MPLPDIAELAELLSSISLSPECPSGDQGTIRLPLIPASDQSGIINADQPLWLSYAQGTTLGFEGLTARIAKELRAHRHADDQEFVLFVLSFAAMLRSGSGGAIDAVNTLLSTICSADVNLCFVLCAELPEYHQYEIPPFRLGRIRADKLKWNCEKAQSDFYDRYRSILQRSWGVEREPKATRVIDISEVRKRIFSTPRVLASVEPWRIRAWESLVNGYFSQQNQALFKEFWSEVISAQDALLTMGAPFLDPRAITSLIQGMQIAVFLNFGSEHGGFVAPAGHGPVALDMANAHERVPRIVKELKDKYNFTGFDETPLHNSAKLFASFVARARRHQIAGHLNEALVHYVIALELIFGERQTIQKSVSERVAVILSTSSEVGFDEHLSSLDRMYEARSRYVHSGKTVSQEALLEHAYKVCGHCFQCLLRLQKASADRSEGVLKRWLETLDYMAKGMIAGKSFDRMELEEAFLV